MKTEQFVATTESEDVFVGGGLGSTPDEAFRDWLATVAPTEVKEIANFEGEEIDVEIWRIRPADEEEVKEGYVWMLDEKIETRTHLATRQQLA
jgi:molybdopterin-biosynthesis enzyme MoeA-like protein